VHSAALLTAVFLAGLIPYAEETPLFKNWLKATFTHHWLGKGALALLVFFFLSIIFSALWRNKKWEPRAIGRLVAAETLLVGLSALTLLGYFFQHAFL